MSKKSSRRTKISYCKENDDTPQQKENVNYVLSLFAHRNGTEVTTPHKIVSSVCEWEFDVCNRYPVYGIRGGFRRFCNEHKYDNMLNFFMPFCREETCESNAFYGIKGSKPVCCPVHKDSNMIRLYRYMCKDPSCISEAFYEFPGNKPSVCNRHKVNGMIRYPLRKCISCKKPAIYGTNKRQDHCEVHKLPNEVNYVEFPCKSCGLTYPLSSKLLCECCDPDSTKWKMTKQNNLMKTLDYVGLHGHSTDVMIDNGICGKERPDRIFMLDDKAIIIECDEYQHKGIDPSCEHARMVNISQSIGGLPVYFIRWNPDNYSSNIIPNAPLDSRYNLLINTLTAFHNYTIRVPHAFLSVLYLFYDNHCIPTDSIPTHDHWKVLMKFDNQ
jgi:hypothetical protein